MADAGLLLIFVDANIYLDCYQRALKDYRNLLPRLASLSACVLTTTQVRDEFNRNRVSAYIKENQVETPKGAYPDLLSHHQIEDEDVDGKKMRQERESIRKQLVELEKLAKEVHIKNISSIVKAEDDVSKMIHPLLSVSVSASAEEFERARLRRETGNPPGKKNDPLGDQLSWEQLLSAAKGKRSIWIVSNDGDYLEKAVGRFYLNPLLSDELAAIAPDASVHCFGNLANFFDEFLKSEYSDLLDKKEPQEVEAAQREYAANTIVQANAVIQITPLLNLGSSPRMGHMATCPGSADGRHRFGEARVAQPSNYGGWTYWQRCDHCGAPFDTGEPYDD
jgi:hypothetical protein